MADLIDSVIDVLQTYEAAEEVLRPVNDAMRVLYGDFYPHQNPATTGIEATTIKLCDKILGEELASYYLYECRSMKGGGKIIEKNGKKWPIRDLKDLRKYARHIQKANKRGA